MIKVRAHTCYLGHSGYSYHARSFFRSLSKWVDLRIRNFTWDDNPDYLNDIDLSIIDQITLIDSNKKLSTYPIKHGYPNYNWKNLNSDFEQDIDIVLVEENHHYFYDNYNSKIKIAYTVWESTLIKDDFFKQLLKFDYLWVVSEWHKNMVINQGYPKDKVFIVNEGVNSDLFYDNIIKEKHLEEINNPEYFNFMFFGRWDYRKFVPEIIESFLKVFPNEEKVNLILGADNSYSTDGMKSTEERLLYYGFNDSRIKVKHFLNRKDYISYIKHGNVLITCARSEGWNIPLIESLAAGTPVIFSNWGAQLEFAKGMETSVKILNELPANLNNKFQYSNNIHGYYAEPDINDLQIKIKECYDNWKEKKDKALNYAKIIRKNFNWDEVGKRGFKVLEEIYNSPIKKNYEYIIHFVDGPFVEILGNSNDNFLIEFIDNENGKILHNNIISSNMWSRASQKYYTNWLIRITNLKTNEISEHQINLKNKRVLISIDSSSLGDSIAWFPPIVEFGKKHNCELIVSTFRNELFEEQYPDIQFVKPGDIVKNIYASYTIGWFYNNALEIDKFKNPIDFKLEPMQKTSCNILGLDYKPTKPILTDNLGYSPINEPYICLGIHSTAQTKYWNNKNGWQELTDYFLKKGRKVIILSNEGNGYMGNYYPIGASEIKGEKTLKNAMLYLKYCEMFIGISSGLSWLSWAMNKPTVIISGWTKPITEIYDNNIIRVFKDNVCNGCFNKYKLDQSNWNWCPEHEGTDRQFECSKSIKSNDVIYEIEKYYKNKNK